jgi:hypothetical protein
LCNFSEDESAVKEFFYEALNNKNPSLVFPLRVFPGSLLDQKSLCKFSEYCAAKFLHLLLFRILMFHCSESSCFSSEKYVYMLSIYGCHNVEIWVPWKVVPLCL